MEGIVAFDAMPPPQRIPPLVSSTECADGKLMLGSAADAGYTAPDPNAVDSDVDAYVIVPLSSPDEASETGFGYTITRKDAYGDTSLVTKDVSYGETTLEPIESSD